jgi:adenylate kinase family enzyme
MHGRKTRPQQKIVATYAKSVIMVSMRIALPFFLQKTQVYAFIGKSGTGKSFHARLVAYKYGISLIIDDGLLIKDNRIIAGRSAKEEEHYIGAVRAALFDSQEMRKEVTERLAAEHFRKILILGTSAKMVCMIAGHLGLPKPGKFIRIEDIATREEIDTALRSRQIEGKHVIPAPQTEVKRKYTGIFFDIIHIRKKNRPLSNLLVTPVYEKSLVRPLYSRRAWVKISETALSQMALLSVEAFNADIKVRHIGIKNTRKEGTIVAGYRLALLVALPGTGDLSELAEGLKRYIIEDIERFTGILIEEVNIIVDKIT